MEPDASFPSFYLSFFFLFTKALFTFHAPVIKHKWSFLLRLNKARLLNRKKVALERVKSGE